jgi:redox-sensitive bicupin YhaK (pirin superfamily)
MKFRKTDQIMYAPVQPMGDMSVRQPLPSARLPYFDPFILLHHAHMTFEEDMDLKHAGVGPHPHRGFSPVTFVFKGGSHHRDSRGNNHLVMAGGTQWMHAGMGIIHSERPVEPEMEIIQMWINTPAGRKMEQPFYRPLSAEDTPVFRSDDQLTDISIVSGQLLGIDGPVPTMTPVNSAMLNIRAGGRVDIPLPPSHQAFIYLLDGRLRLGATEVNGKHMAIFENTGDGISVEALQDTRALLMSGEPIREKIVAHGPFVMNSDTEIMEAFRDYRMGKMGILIED